MQILGSTWNLLNLTLWGWHLGTYVLNKYAGWFLIHTKPGNEILSQHLLPRLAPSPCVCADGLLDPRQDLPFSCIILHFVWLGALPQPIKICWVLYSATYDFMTTTHGLRLKILMSQHQESPSTLIPTTVNQLLTNSDLIFFPPWGKYTDCNLSCCQMPW